jgi:hypothetical protein
MVGEGRPSTSLQTKGAVFGTRLSTIPRFSRCKDVDARDKPRAIRLEIRDEG